MKMKRKMKVNPNGDRANQDFALIDCSVITGQDQEDSFAG